MSVSCLSCDHASEKDPLWRPEQVKLHRHTLFGQTGDTDSRCLRQLQPLVVSGHHRHVEHLHAVDHHGGLDAVLLLHSGDRLERSTNKNPTAVVSLKQPLETLLRLKPPCVEMLTFTALMKSERVKVSWP